MPEETTIEGEPKYEFPEFKCNGFPHAKYKFSEEMWQAFELKLGAKLKANTRFAITRAVNHYIEECYRYLLVREQKDHGRTIDSSANARITSFTELYESLNAASNAISKIHNDKAAFELLAQACASQQINLHSFATDTISLAAALKYAADSAKVPNDPIKFLAIAVRNSIKAQGLKTTLNNYDQDESGYFQFWRLFGQSLPQEYAFKPQSEGALGKMLSRVK